MPTSMQSLLALLACPVCHGPLTTDAPMSGSVVVRCSGCGRGYPVVDGIPVLIAARATDRGE